MNQKHFKTDDPSLFNKMSLNVDIFINNVLCTFNLRCRLDLEDILERGHNVELRESKYILMKMKKFSGTAKIWSTGKVVCTGSKSEEEAKIVSRRFARQLQRLGYNVRFANFKIHNCHGSVLLPFQIKIKEFSQAHQEASYEPELHTGIIYKVEAFSATLRIHRSGNMTIMAPSEIDIKEAVEFTANLVQTFATPTNDIQENLGKRRKDCIKEK